MTAFARRWMLPLLFLNITTSSNLWTMFGLNIGQFLYWVIIALAFTVVLDTPYRRLGMIALLVSLLLRVIETVNGSVAVEALRIASLGLMFVIAGARLYGEDPRVLQRQLIVFLALSIPVMLLQITGAHSVFMMWNTEYAHDPAVLTQEEYGTFKVIPVYPTLFRSEDEVQFMIGQGRPVGLLYSNNVLSIFVGITAALHLAMARTARFRKSDVIVVVALVLTMSLTSFATAGLVYVAFLVFGEPWRRQLAFRLTCLVALALLAYRILFPGLFDGNMSNSKFSISLLTRGLDLANALGLDSFIDLFAEQQQMFSRSLLPLDESTYSLYSQMLKSTIAIPLGVITAAVAIAYARCVKMLRHTTGASWTVYGVTGFACLLTQVGTNYIAAPSLQMILGLAFFPLFKRLWPGMEEPPTPVRQKRPSASTA